MRGIRGIRGIRGWVGERVEWKGRWVNDAIRHR